MNPERLEGAGSGPCPASQAIHSSPVGALLVMSDGRHLVGISFQTSRMVRARTPDAITHRVLEQMQNYFDDPDWEFSLPLRLQGTHFQRRVWEHLLRIPSGQVQTYGQVAGVLGTSPRAVGNACRANPCPIVVPCHRVVGAGGSGGYAGRTGGRLHAIKHWLLRHEGVSIG